MLRYFKITSENIYETNAGDYNWLVLDNASASEKSQLVDQYKLPADVFDDTYGAETVTRFEYLPENGLDKMWRLTVMDLSPETNDEIERRLHPITFLKSPNLLIMQVPMGSNLIDRLIQDYQNNPSKMDSLVLYGLLRLFIHFNYELVRQKQIIEELDQAARVTARNAALYQLTDTTKDLVYLRHALQNLQTSLKQFWAESMLAKDMPQLGLKRQIEHQQQYAEKQVAIYVDLVETIGGLFTDMMNNNLNHLMQYLNTAALLLAVPSLIAGIWGMNVGSLPGERTRFAFWVVLGIMTVITIVYGLYLAKKDYTK